MSIKPEQPYPLGTKDSIPIPHDVCLPMGVIPVSIGATEIKSIPAVTPNPFMLAITAYVDCYIDLRSSPSAVAADQYTQGVCFVKANTTKVIATYALKHPYSGFAVHGMGTAGKVIIEPFSAWGAVGEDIQREVL